MFDALAAGAHGYVPKQHSPPQMVAGFQAVLKGNIYVPASVCDEPTTAIDPSPCDGQPRLLTQRQREVLTLLTIGKSNKEIARDLMISESTVKVHLAAAFRLLGVRSRMAAAAALREFKAAGSHSPPSHDYATPGPVDSTLVATQLGTSLGAGDRDISPPPLPAPRQP